MNKKMEKLTIIFLGYIIHILTHLGLYIFLTGNFPYRNGKKIPYTKLSLLNYTYVVYGGFFIGIIWMLFFRNWFLICIYMVIFSRDIHLMYFSVRCIKAFGNDEVVENIRLIKQE